MKQLAYVLSIVYAAGVCSAQLIDFETTPSGATPVDNGQLDRTAPYAVDGRLVTIGFDSNRDGVTDTNARFERRLADGSDGFVSTTGPASHDSERPGASSDLGQYFLRQPAAIGSVPGVMIVEYDAPVRSFSGEIWDIDASTAGFEQWRITARDGAGAILAVVESPRGLDVANPDSLDSLPWFFAFNDVGDIIRVELEYIGSASNTGLAFNNYSATGVASPLIAGQPECVLLPSAGATELTVDAFGVAPLRYQWRRDGVDLVDGGGVSGATTATLNLDLTPDLVGLYDVVVSNDFGAATSDTAVVALRCDGSTGCYADCDGNGVLDFFDFLCFQNAFAAGCP